jgi:hypothetical protein
MRVRPGLAILFDIQASGRIEAGFFRAIQSVAIEDGFSGRIFPFRVR